MKRTLILLAAALLLLAGCTFEKVRTSTEPSRQCEKPVETQTQPTKPEVTEPSQADPTDSPLQSAGNNTDFKGVWLSQYDLSAIYLDNGAQRAQSDFTSRMAQVLDNVMEQGFNTVVLQVRPNGDSMYPSDYYPVSKYVVGEYGLDAIYDPVAIIVELAKERGLKIHAWINPMRCMATADLFQVSTDYLLRQWYDDPRKNGTYLVQSGTYWYLNPAYEEVRELIVSGATEILERYGFDGLHMDDYFYPTTDESFDAAAFAVMGEGLDLADFRRKKLNSLVASLYDAVKAFGSEKLFGISPAGNITTVYESQYADVYTWCSVAGYIDYICPQVYFGLEHQRYDFVSVCNTWQNIIQTETVDLIVGMTFEKALTQEDAYAGTGKNEWKEHTDILKRCLEYTAQLEKCRGVCIFSYQHFYDPSTGAEIAETAAEREEFVPALEVITWLHRGGVG